METYSLTGDPRKETMLEMLELYYGLIHIALKASHVSKTLHQNWMKSDNDYREAVNEIKERLKDAIEYKLLNNIQMGDQRAIEYYLNCQARDRGYSRDGQTQPIEDGKQVPTWMQNLASRPITDEELSEQEENHADI